MANTSGTSYDEVPYESRAFHESHPDRLATLAILHGLKPPDIATARVLEIGCAAGGNLIPMALAWPKARFVGIDLSPRQVADGQAIVKDLGLTNIELREQDLATFGPKAGKFDYIIAHGVYSWVPEAARDRCLAICSANLAQNGIAFVSYNTYPGWHGLGMLREMMLYHIGPLGEAEARQRVKEARALLDVLAEAAPDAQSPYVQLIRREVHQIRAKSDAYLLHDHLEAENHPVYFHEFLDHAARHGLKHLADARLRTMFAYQPAPLRCAIEELTDDPSRREQYVDFFRNRTFRRTLLIHEAAEPRPIQPEALDRLRALAASGPASGRFDPRAAAVEEFVGMEGQSRFATGDPAVKACLLALCESWPRSIPITELHSRARAALQGDSSADTRPARLNEALLTAFHAGAIDLHSAEPRFATAISDRPEGSPYARLQARQSNLVTSLRHRIVELSAFDRLVLGQLDGQRDRAEILDELVSAAVSGAFPLHRDGQPIQDAIEIRRILDRSLDPALARLRGGALLMA
jgi:methyltransferase-like protein/2-polyprenyl-3-methyl-5-hydroxy-6-metoxy-1,4-benzoquinol methylase